MTKEDLIKSAGTLNQPSERAAKEYEHKGEEIANELTSIFNDRKDINQLVGEGNLSMMEDNHRNHYRFISSLLINYQPAVLVDTVLWVFRAYRSHGFQLLYWPAQLSQWVELLRKHLSEESFNEIYPIYKWMLVNQSGFVEESDKIVLANKIVPQHHN